ncbi:MAG TPA: SdrD B-like domain-containing protein, partial [Saprospiraceae bacterium]|nr:SdrD B-like domain-containing protein [Saprospiraceae bacterium]
ASGNYINVAQIATSDQLDPDSTPNNDNGDQSEDDEDSAAADPMDLCNSGIPVNQFCDIILANPSSNFALSDCDGDGQSNLLECENGTDPMNPCSNSYTTADQICTAIENGAYGLADSDCDKGGITNGQECIDGTDPTDPCDDAGLTATAICTIVSNDPNGILALSDCDGDGQTNAEECANGTDPTNPCSNSYSTGEEVCLAIQNGAFGLLNVDCDNGGINDDEECINGTDPTDPDDDYGFVEGIVFKDLNGDGIRGYGDYAIPNVLVELTDCNGNVVDATYTDSNGIYKFSGVQPGNYMVHFDISGLPEGCDFTLPNQGGNDNIDSDSNNIGNTNCFVHQTGNVHPNIDAGLVPLSSIGNRIWHDINGNGIQDSNEPGIGGVLVQLLNANGIIIETTTTDGNGYYLFDNLYFGYYSLVFATPVGYEATFLNVGANDEIDSDINLTSGATELTYLAPGENDLTWDAGYYHCVPIGDLVWYDIDEDDQWDGIENGINGLEVQLWKKQNGIWTLWESTYTDHKPNTPSDDGYFQFCAPPGEYYVQVILPPYGLVPAVKDATGYMSLTNPSEQDDDSDLNYLGKTDAFTVTSGMVINNIGAGYYPQAAVGNLVWIDTNQDGVQDSSEPKVANVKVQAYNSNNDLIGETYTDGNGLYEIGYLQKQSYYLKFEAPSGYAFTAPNTTNENEDSDVDDSNGPGTTKLYALQPGNVYTNVDAGLAFSALPLTWLDVFARRINDDNEVSWITESEKNVNEYEVYRRKDSESNFAFIGKLKAKGNDQNITNTYKLLDTDASDAGIYYYYVSGVDFDGKKSDSKEVFVKVYGGRQIEIYPNPAIDKFNLVMNLAEENEFSLSIYTIEGKYIRSLQINETISEGNHDYLYNIHDLTPGAYNVEIKLGTEIINKKLIIVD